jgi:cyclopropane fatty-acyl-phospholipid synthase-like methyltransferase
MKDLKFTKDHKEKIDRFLKERTSVEDRKLATRFHDSDAHVYDLGFIRPHLSQGAHVLDLGCGSGILAYEAAKTAEHVLAVDKFEEFFDPQYRADNMEFEKSDILEFSRAPVSFDVILLFGVVTYLDYDETRRIYSRIAGWLRDDGVLLAKHGCGVTEDVFVDGFSKHLQSHYVALYKYLETEKDILSEYFASVEVTDIYPDHLNRWDDTRYYAFICRKT